MAQCESCGGTGRNTADCGKPTRHDPHGFTWFAIPQICEGLRTERPCDDCNGKGTK